MRTVRLILAYDGSAYAGWQMQPDKPTVQQALEDALREVTGGEQIRPVASSRTDAGVHALGQLVSFTTSSRLPADVFSRGYAWYVPQSLDIGAMTAAAAGLVGTHDYCAFENQGSEREDTVRTVHELFCLPRRINNSDHLHIEIAGDGFLYNMVRNIAGTLVAVGRGKFPPEWPAQVLASRDRKLGGMTAPPQGLFLLKVEYREQ